MTKFLPALLDYYSEPDFYRSIRVNPNFIAYMKRYNYSKSGKDIVLYQCEVYNGNGTLTCYIREEDYKELIGEQNEKES